jgi:hypothetical protein
MNPLKAELHQEAQVRVSGMERAFRWPCAAGMSRTVVETWVVPDHGGIVAPGVGAVEVRGMKATARWTMVVVAMVFAGLAGLAGLVGCTKPPEAGGTSESPGPLTEAERRWVVERGDAIAAETFGLLRTNLQGALQTGGVSQALPFCSLAASPLTAGMAAKHGVGLRRVTMKARNPAAKADAVEAGILERFAAELGSPAGISAVVTNTGGGTVTYLAPIVIASELCLKCHGEPGRDIAETDLQIIRRLYPADAAVGYGTGALRGAWRIDFPRSAVVVAAGAGAGGGG